MIRVLGEDPLLTKRDDLLSRLRQNERERQQAAPVSNSETIYRPESSSGMSTASIVLSSLLIFYLLDKINR